LQCKGGRGGGTSSTPRPSGFCDEGLGTATNARTRHFGLREEAMEETEPEQDSERLQQSKAFRKDY